MKEISSLYQLFRTPYGFVPARDKFLTAVREKLDGGKEPFAGIYSLDHEKRKVTEILAGGRAALLVGNYGSGKTELAKSILGLLNDYYAKHPSYCISDCPVQEDPSGVAFYLGLNKRRNFIEPCPICRKRHLGRGADPRKIPVRRVSRLSEGGGFARIQSGSDVMPEEIIGSYNIIKLARIGDPFDPEVFQPGKICQANGGLLFVDEIGKLSESGQYALLQAVQEGIVTPSKSRETFSVDILLVATSNPEDEEEIRGAVADRLVSVSIPFADRENEIKIVRKELDKYGKGVYFPALYAGLIVDIVRLVRQKGKAGVTQRAGINAAAVARSSALLEKRRVVTYCDAREGIFTAILGCSKLEDMEDTEKLLRKEFPQARDYIGGIFPDLDMAGPPSETGGKGGTRGGRGKHRNNRALSEALLASEGPVSTELLDALVKDIADACGRGCSAAG